MFQNKIKICHFCRNKFLENKYNYNQRFCSRHCQNKSYKLNHKDILKQYSKQYKLKNKEKLNIQKKNWRKNWSNDYREKHNSYYRNRRKNDILFNITCRLRGNLRFALRYYSKTGKLLKARKYGIDYEKIINHLKPFPMNIEKYHIDHIVPLSSFDLTNYENIKKAFAPENHQWLLATENIKKGNRIPFSCKEGEHGMQLPK